MLVLLSCIIGFLLGIILGVIVTFIFLKKRIEQKLMDKVKEIPLTEMAKYGFKVSMDILKQKFKK